MALVPRLALGALATQAAGTCEEAQEEALATGRATARTRNRALLRAKARARRREERDQQLVSAREPEPEVAGYGTARVAVQVETLHEEEKRKESQLKANVLASGSGAEPLGQASKTKCEESDISECSSEEDRPLKALVAAPFSPLHAWEYPLSAAEKKNRLMLIFNRTEALSERHIRRCERREEKLRTKVRLHRQDSERLRRERNDLCREAASLRNENRDLREKVKDLEKRLQQSQQQQQQAACTRTASSCSRSIAAPVPEESEASEDEDESPPMTARLLLPARGCGPAGVATSMETPRGLSMVTPRGGAARIGMRGTVASVAWGEADQVPWAAFTNRSTGLLSLYGDRDASEIEEAQVSLRRGEYIRSISGSWSAASTPSEPAIAQCLRIVTSEQQEIVAGGEAAAAPDFHFEADEDFEIVGLTLQDGNIAGVKQAMLAPSRVPTGLAAAMAGGGLGSSSAEIASEVEAATSSLQRSMQALRRNSMARNAQAKEPR